MRTMLNKCPTKEQMYDFRWSLSSPEKKMGVTVQYVNKVNWEEVKFNFRIKFQNMTEHDQPL